MRRVSVPIVDLEFPYPPSMDQYWPCVGARITLGRDGKQYRERVASILAQYNGPPLEGPLSGHITFHPPDQRRCELDDAIAAMLDALAHTSTFEDDSQICALDVRRGPSVPSGKVVVLVEDAS